MARPRLSRYRRRRDPLAVVFGLAGSLLLVPTVTAQAPPFIDLSSITHPATPDTIPDQDLYLEVAALRRMDTRWTYSDPGRLWTWTAGDFITGGLPWARPVRMGGLQWRRNFGVRPDLVTVPVPRFRGEAAVPSSVELYVDNVRRYRAEVQEGPFVVDAIPRVTGAGIAQMVVTDALGRVTQTQFPIYSDRQLLATGLTDFSVELGALRRGFSAAGDAYLGEVAFSSSVRHGASRTVTFEGHAEASDGLYVVGVGAVFSPWPRAGLFSGSYSRSAGRADGDRFSLGYQLVSGGWGLDLQTRRHTSGFRELADLVPASDSVIDTTRRLFNATHLQTIRDLDQATLWLPVPRGSIALSWLNWRSHAGDRHGTGTVSLTQMLGPVSLSASVFGDDVGVGGGLNLSVPLGPQRYASSSLNHRGGRTTTSLSMRQSRPYDGGWGWALQAGAQADPYAQVEASVRGDAGEGRFGLGHFQGVTRAIGEISGSIAAMGGQLFLSRPIHDAFAVVSTNGRGGVPVLSENRVFGETNDNGYLLITDLRGWQLNRVGIEPTALLIGEQVSDFERVITPADRTGVLLDFDVRTGRPARVILLGPDGEPATVGRSAQVLGTEEEVVVGYGGEVYISDLSSSVVIEVRNNGSICRYRVDALPGSGERGQPLVGPVPCEEVAG